eukprot:jgi/Mesvir1/26852/Mv20602-RA.1
MAMMASMATSSNAVLTQHVARISPSSALPRSSAAVLRGSPLLQRQGAGPVAAFSNSRKDKKGNVAVSAVLSEPTPSDAIAQGMGFDTSDGIFGFTPFAELWAGRLAMMGFATGAAEELLTGHGILRQIGLTTPNDTLLLAITILAGGATLLATIRTVDAVQKGKLSAASLSRYRSFLGLTSEAVDIRETSTRMKKQGGFLAADDMRAVAESQGKSPADQVLSSMTVTEIDADAAQLKARDEAFLKGKGVESVSAPTPRTPVSSGPASDLSAWSYARNVEMTNGRWAMLGFLAAITVEAATGNGILGQLFEYAKLSGCISPAWY